MNVRDRVGRDGAGYFIGLDGPDSVAPVQTLDQPENEENPGTRPSTARTDVPEDSVEDDTEIPGQVEDMADEQADMEDVGMNGDEVDMEAQDNPEEDMGDAPADDSADIDDM